MKQKYIDLLNEFDGDVILIYFNEWTNGELDDFVNNSLQDCDEEELKNFFDALKRRNKDIEVIKNE